MDNHPEWCGAHPKTHFNEDYCLNCDDVSEETCLTDHPKDVIHRRQVDFPANWFGLDPDNFNLWVSMQPGDKKPQLWAAYDSMNEDDANPIEIEDLKSLINDLSKLLKAL